MPSHVTTLSTCREPHVRCVARLLQCGSKGIAAVVELLRDCVNLVTLRMGGVGLDDCDGAVLTDAVNTSRGAQITELVLPHNKLGQGRHTSHEPFPMATLIEETR